MKFTIREKLIFIIVLVILFVGATKKISELTQDNTLVDDDLFIITTSETSKSTRIQDIETFMSDSLIEKNTSANQMLFLKNSAIYGTDSLKWDGANGEVDINGDINFTSGVIKGQTVTDYFDFVLDTATTLTDTGYTVFLNSWGTAITITESFILTTTQNTNLILKEMTLAGTGSIIDTLTGTTSGYGKYYSYETSFDDASIADSSIIYFKRPTDVDKEIYIRITYTYTKQ